MWYFEKCCKLKLVMSILMIIIAQESKALKRCGEICKSLWGFLSRRNASFLSKEMGRKRRKKSVSFSNNCGKEKIRVEEKGEEEKNQKLGVVVALLFCSQEHKQKSLRYKVQKRRINNQSDTRLVRSKIQKWVESRRAESQRAKVFD